MLNTIRQDLIGLDIDRVYRYFEQETMSSGEQFCSCLWNEQMLNFHKKYMSRSNRIEVAKDETVVSRFRKSVPVVYVHRKDFAIINQHGMPYTVEVFFALNEKQSRQHTFNALHTTHKDKYKNKLSASDDLFDLYVCAVEFTLHDVEDRVDDVIKAYESDRVAFTTYAPYAEALALVEKHQREIDAINKVIEQWGGSEKFTFGT